MDLKLDARGFACPRPALDTAKALAGLDKGTLLVIVDNAAARDNVSRLARNKGYTVSVEEKDGDYHLTISKA